MDQDFLLVQKMKSGDEAALESFVRKYYPTILSYCRCHISSQDLAEDLTQETFEHFFRALSNYRHYGKAVNYLYVIAGNLCRNQYAKKRELLLDGRSRADEEESPWEALEELASVENADAATDPIFQAETRLDLERAMRRLPDELREVLILHYFQDLKQKEIARILDIGLPLVKYRIRKAKEELGSILGEGEKT